MKIKRNLIPTDVLDNLLATAKQTGLMATAYACIAELRYF